MRCLFCGKRLALLRKLTDGEFCSTAHRKRYLEEEQKLALARLIEEQHRSGQRRAAEAASECRRAERPQELAEFRPPQIQVRAALFEPVVAPQSLERTIDAQMVERQACASGLARALRCLGAEAAGVKGDPRDSAPARAVAEVTECCFPPAVLHRQYAYAPSPVVTARDTRLETVSPLSPAKDSPPVSPRKSKTSIFLKLIPPIRPRTASSAPPHAFAEPPLIATGLTPAQCGAARIRAAELAHAAPAGAVAGLAASGLQTTGIALEHASLAERPGIPERLASEIRWHGGVLAGSKGPGRARIPAEPAALGRWSIPAGRTIVPERVPATALEVTSGPDLCHGTRSELPAPPAMPFAAVPPSPAAPSRRVHAGGLSPKETALARLPEAEVRALPATAAHADAADFTPRLGDPPLPPVSAVLLGQENLPAEQPLTLAVVPFRMAAREPLAVAPAAGLPAHPVRAPRFIPAIQPCQPLARAAWRPDMVAGPVIISSQAWQQPMPPEAGEVRRRCSSPMRECGPSAQGGLVALTFASSPRRVSFRRPETPAPATLSPKRVLPKLYIETVMPSGLGQKTKAPAEPSVDARQAKPWTAAPHFWKRAPADLKWISLALPAILLVTVISSIGWLPSKRAKTARGPEPTRSSYLENVVLERWASVKRNIGNRAAINLQDDFRSGLAEWEGEGNWAKDWQYDPAGFILTGPLALYRPSSELIDYHFEFLGQIDKKSLNWVFRAADYKNYYAMKIVLLKSAPLPTAAIVRYAVVNGKPDRPVQLPLPMPVRTDMFYRVRVDVRDQNFTTTVQGQVVDFWSDDRLSRGGVGFFSEKGERARLRWMEVSHQYDALGRLCALLAPYSIQSGNGSLNRP